MIFRPFEEKDTEELILRVRQNLTEGDPVVQGIRDNVAIGNYFGGVAEEDGKFLGFATAKEGFEFTVPHPKLEKEIRDLFPGKRFFVGDQMWVSPEARGHGVAGRMLEITRQEVLARGGDYWLTELWVYPDGKSPVKDVAEGCGEKVFERLVPMFYKDQDRYGLKCPICGDHCRCSAMVRVYHVTDREKEQGNE